MNTSGDAAEQVVRLSLEGMEVAAKITGSAAKEVAALLYAALKNRDKNKIKGRQRLTSMLRSGKELTIFTVKNKDMARFVADAKRYGVVYCVLREAKDNPHGVSEIMVRAEDAAKINRIVENIKIATVDVKSLSEMLGHADVRTTLQVYVHSSLEHKMRVIQSICFLAPALAAEFAPSPSPSVFPETLQYQQLLAALSQMG